MNTLNVLNTRGLYAILPDAHLLDNVGHSPWEALRMRGRFKVTSHMIESHPEVAMRLFRHMIIVRAEHSFMNDTIEYDAYSPLFRALKEGERAPYYTFSFDSETESITATESGT